MPFELIKSETLLQGRAFKIRRDYLKTPDGKETKFEIVDKAKRLFEKQGLKVNGIDGARVEFSDGWGLVRASNTQPVLVYRFEAVSQSRLDEIRKIIEGTVSDLIVHP